MSGGYLFTYISIVYLLLGWALYLPYRLRQLHFLAVACSVVGAYVGAVAMLNFAVPWWLALPLVALIGALVGFLVSLIVAEAPTFTVVIVGLTALIIVRTIASNTPYLGSSLGLFGLPAVNRGALMVVAVGLALATILCMWLFERSTLGLAARAAYSSRGLVAAQGYSIPRLGRLLQTVSCGLGATAGFLYILPFRNLFPGFFDFGFLGTVVTMLFVGGHGTPYGLFISVPVLWGLSFVLPDSIENLRLVIYAVALIVVLVFRPEGLLTRRLVVRAVRRLSSGKGDR